MRAHRWIAAIIVVCGVVFALGPGAGTASASPAYSVSLDDATREQARNKLLKDARAAGVERQRALELCDRGVAALVDPDHRVAQISRRQRTGEIARQEIFQAGVAAREQLLGDDPVEPVLDLTRGRREPRGPARRPAQRADDRGGVVGAAAVVAAGEIALH